MPDIHDQALDWANQNSGDPRAKDIQAKAWAAQNPNDPRSAQVLQKIQAKTQAPQQGQAQAQPNPFQTANAIEQKQGSPDFLHQAAGMWGAYSGSVVKGATLGNFSPKGTDEAAAEHPVLAGVGHAVGSIAPALLAGTGVGAIGEGLGLAAESSGMLPYLAKAAGRVALGTGAGGLEGLLRKPDGADTPEQRLANAGTAAKWGAIGSTAAEGIQAVPALSKYFSSKAASMNKQQADAYIKDPAGVEALAKQMDSPQGLSDMQMQAAERMQKARSALRTQGLAADTKLDSLLKDTQGEVNPKDVWGLHPGVDAEIYAAHPARNPHSLENQNYAKFEDMPKDAQADYVATLPDKAILSGVGIRKAKQKAQEAADFYPSTLTDPTAISKAKEMGKLQHTLGDVLDQAGSKAGVDVPALDSEMQRGIFMQKELAQGQRRSPIAALSSDSLDRRASLYRAGDQAGEDLNSFADRIGAAKTINPRDVDDAVSRTAIRAAGRFGLRNQSRMEKAASPYSLQSIMALINENKADTQE